MPYIITTRWDYRGMPSHEFADRRAASVGHAVARFDEAREVAEDLVKDAFSELNLHEQEFPPEWDGAVDAAQELPDTGGTIGPLPDGSVIEVRHLSWIDFGQLVRGLHGYCGGGHRDIDAYNAQ